MSQARAGFRYSSTRRCAKGARTAPRQCLEYRKCSLAWLQIRVCLLKRRPRRTSILCEGVKQPPRVKSGERRAEGPVATDDQSRPMARAHLTASSRGGCHLGTGTIGRRKRGRRGEAIARCPFHLPGELNSEATRPLCLFHPPDELNSEAARHKRRQASGTSRLPCYPRAALPSRRFQRGRRPL